MDEYKGIYLHMFYLLIFLKKDFAAEEMNGKYFGIRGLN